MGGLGRWLSASGTIFLQVRCTVRRFLGVALAAAFFSISGSPARADDEDAKSILDKAIKAIGGEEKLGKVEAFSWKSKGVVIFNGNENESRNEVTVKGLDHFRREFGNDQFHGWVVLSGEKGWRKFGDDVGELEGDFLANEKRNLYLHVIPITLVPLKGNGFKYETAGEEKVSDRPAFVLKIIGPDGKDFTLSFDKESRIPVKQVAKVIGFQGQEHTQETTFADYKDFDGIKKATKVEIKRDGERFQTMEITEFKVLDKVDPEVFTQPR
jgi:hypothetical protein